MNSLEYYRNAFRILNKDGNVPGFRTKARFNNQEISVVVNSDHTLTIPPGKIGSTNDAGQIQNEYRVHRRGQEQQIERNLRSKHSGLEWQQRGASVDAGIIEMGNLFDASFLSDLSTARTVAKYALNLLTWHFGVHYTGDRFRGLVDFIRFGTHTGAQPAGVIARSPQLGVVQLEPPKHQFFTYADADHHRVVVVMFLLSLFPFCVVADEPTLGVEVFHSAQLDPVREGIPDEDSGFLRPIITMRTFPERPFTQAVAGLPRGGAAEAESAAKAAELWLKAQHAQRFSRAFHLCYGCGRMLNADQLSCPKCGEAVPEGVAELGKRLR